MSQLRSEARREARRQLWRMRKVWPLLQVYLDRDQLADIRAFMRGGDAETGRLPSEGWYDDVSRQRGKSWKWTVFDVVWAHCHPGQQLKYLAQTGVSVRGIIAPVIQELIDDMPPEFRPKQEGAESIREDKQDHKWHFPHLGKAPSTFHATGANNQHYKALRGPRAHKIVQDECGFYDDFDAVQSALLPMLLTTKGPCVYATTPAETPTHPSEVRRNGLKAQGRYVHRTIHGHPRLSAEDIEEELTKRAAEKGQTLEQFKASSYYRREYLCMHIVEEARAVVPEWSGDAGPGWPEGATWGDVHTFVDLPRPLFYDAYDSLDIGFSRDPSAWIGGYWDWSNARLVIEAETPPLYRTRSDALAVAIREQRARLWPRSGTRPNGDARPDARDEHWQPHTSVGDGSGNGAEKLGELATEGLHFIHANKVDLEARVNALRTLVAQGKLYVHRRCVHLRKQLSMGLWAGTQKVDFERTEEGHLDHLSALVDLVGHVDRQRRPVPVNWGVDTHNTVDVAPGVSRGNMALDKALGEVEWD